MERKNNKFKTVSDVIILNWIKNKKQFFNLFDIVINKWLLNNFLIYFITINKDCLHNKLNEDINSNLKFMNEVLWGEKYQTEFTIILPELNKNGVDHYHILFVMRTMTNHNSHILKNLANNMRVDISNDTHIEQLYKFESIKNKFIYLFKDTYFLEHTINTNDTKYKENNLSFLNITTSKENSDFYKDIHKLTDSIGLKNVMLNKVLDIHNWGSSNDIYDDRFSRKTILLMIQYFIKCNGILIKNDSVYGKIHYSLISYKKIGDLNWFSENISLIYNYMLTLYPINFYGIDLNNISLESTYNKDVIEKYIKTTDKINFDFSILEFKDGLYFMREDKFIKKELISTKLNALTLKYYEKNYNTERQKKPTQWIKAIEYVTNFDENSEQFKEFCSRIANLVIKNQQISGKKKVLYIWGDSSTGKTTLIAKPLWKFFEKENIGIISGNSNFAYDYVINKELVIWDEAVIDKKKREEILKFFENQPIIANRKYKEQVVLTNIEKVALSNYSLDPVENKKYNHFRSYTDAAIFNRVYSVKFEPKYENKEIHDEKMGALLLNIENEDPNIMIYCNKILTKKYGKTRRWYKNILQQLEEKNYQSVYKITNE